MTPASWFPAVPMFQVNPQVKAARELRKLFISDRHKVLFVRSSGQVIDERKVSSVEVNRRRDELIGADFRFDAWRNVHPLSRRVDA